MRQKEGNLAWVTLQCISLWIFVVVVYHSVFNVLGFDVGYGTHPVESAIYFALWTIVAVIAFFPILRSRTLVDNWHRALLWGSVFVSVIGTLYLVLLPLTPLDSRVPLDTTRYWFLATEPFFFFPKFFDIALQQVLITVFILASFRKFESVTTVAFMALFVFGFTHLLLVFIGFDLGMTLLFSIFACIGALIFPYLIIRVENGVIYSYALHWLWYIILALLARG